MSASAVCDAAVARRGGLGPVAAYGWSRRRGFGRERVDSAIGQRKDRRSGSGRTRTEEKRANEVVCGAVDGHNQVPGRGARSQRTTATATATITVMAGRTTIRQGLDGDGRRGSANAKERERRRRRRRNWLSTGTHIRSRARFKLGVGRRKRGRSVTPFRGSASFGHCPCPVLCCCPRLPCRLWQGGRANHLGQVGTRSIKVTCSSPNGHSQYPSIFANKPWSTSLLETHCTRVHSREKAVAPVVSTACREIAGPGRPCGRDPSEATHWALEIRQPSHGCPRTRDGGGMEVLMALGDPSPQSHAATESQVLRLSRCRRRADSLCRASQPRGSMCPAWASETPLFLFIVCRGVGLVSVQALSSRYPCRLESRIFIPIPPTSQPHATKLQRPISPIVSAKPHGPSAHSLALGWEKGEDGDGDGITFGGGCYSTSKCQKSSIFSSQVQKTIPIHLCFLLEEAYIAFPSSAYTPFATPPPNMRNTLP
jgi:hypothetical protein